MAYLLKSTGPGTSNTVSFSGWMRVPAANWPRNDYLFYNSGSYGWFYCGFSGGTTISLSAGWQSPYGYLGGFGDYYACRGEASAQSVDFPSASGDKWFLTQVSVNSVSGNIGSGPLYGGHGTATFAVNATGLANYVPSCQSHVMGFHTLDYYPYYYTSVLPWANFGTWPMDVAGNVAFPSKYLSTAMEFAEIYIWYNTFIDFAVSANRLRFVNISDSVATPAPASTIISAFGTPTYNFRGKASDSSFYFNRGSGGAFSKVGTVSDFTPAPSY